GIETADGLRHLRVLFSRREPRSDGGRAPAGNRRTGPIAEASMSRPQDLREVAAATIAGTKSFGNAIDEFIDTFYLDHPDKARQQRRLDEPPAIVGDPFIDAWIGAVGEHLARRGNLRVPAWTRRPQHDPLSP